jgi:hypothetical protein
MTIQNINIGQFANDGTGDDLREAFRKINENFDELDLRDPESTTASNLGTGTAVFNAKVGDDLQFKTLAAGDKIAITDVSGNRVQIATDLSGLLVVSDAGSNNYDDGDTFRINGGTGIRTTVSGNTLTIESTGDTTIAFDNDLDYGDFEFTTLSHADYMRQFIDVDYGTITTPKVIKSDLGTIV